MKLLASHGFLCGFIHQSFLWLLAKLYNKMNGTLGKNEFVMQRRRRSDIRKRLGKILRRRIKMEPITSAFVLWKQVNSVEARRERWERRKIGDDDGDDIMMGLLLKNRTSIVESRGKYSFARLYCVYCCKRRVFRAWIGYMAGDTSL